MIKIGSKLKILKTANKATALLPNGKISKVASMEDKSEYSDDFIYFIARALTANVPNANGDYFPDDELEKSYERSTKTRFFNEYGAWGRIFLVCKG